MHAYAEKAYKESKNTLNLFKISCHHVTYNTHIRNGVVFHKESRQCGRPFL